MVTDLEFLDARPWSDLTTEVEDDGPARPWSTASTTRVRSAIVSSTGGGATGRTSGYASTSACATTECSRESSSTCRTESRGPPQSSWRSTSFTLARRSRRISTRISPGSNLPTSAGWTRTTSSYALRGVELADLDFPGHDEGHPASRRRLVEDHR